jgi:hypothetical protein
MQVWHNLSFISIAVLFEEAFKYGKGSNFGGCVGTNTEPHCV